VSDFFSDVDERCFIECGQWDLQTSVKTSRAEAIYTMDEETMTDDEMPVYPPSGTSPTSVQRTKSARKSVGEPFIIGVAVRLNCLIRLT
jgi:hypothetical protein